MKQDPSQPSYGTKATTSCKCEPEKPHLYNDIVYTSNRMLQPRDVMALVWATPVRADQLGASLEKYVKCKARFIKGMTAWLAGLQRVLGDRARLVTEIGEMIEQHYYQASIPAAEADNHWHLRYHCLQGTCTSFSHVIMSGVLERHEAEMHQEHCPDGHSCHSRFCTPKRKPAAYVMTALAPKEPEVAENNDSFSASDESAVYLDDSTYGSIDSDEPTCYYKNLSEKEYQTTLEAYVMRAIQSYPGYRADKNPVINQHYNSIGNWLALTNMDKCKSTGGPGNFVRLSKVLKEDFGLEVQFYVHFDHDYHTCRGSQHPDLACFAYLHLPAPITPLSVATCTTTVPPEMRVQHSIHGTRFLSMAQLREVMEEVEGKKRRFDKAMTYLVLEPFIHPLQFSLPMESSKPQVGEMDEAMLEKERKEFVERKQAEEWPQLLELVHLWPSYGFDIERILFGL